VGRKATGGYGPALSRVLPRPRGRRSLNRSRGVKIEFVHLNGMKAWPRCAQSVPMARESGRPIHMQAATPGGAGRNDFSARMTEHRCHEEATAHHWTRLRGVAARALRRHFRDRLMLPLAVAFPVALLPIMVLVATLRWMAISTG
jgi:hypothetical protein